MPPLGDDVGVSLLPTPDGGLWLAEDPSQCSDDWAVARFDVDGPTWRHFLSGHCISEADLALAPDGAVWLLARELGGLRDLHVITPEAVGAAE